MRCPCSGGSTCCPASPRAPHLCRSTFSPRFHAFFPPFPPCFLFVFPHSFPWCCLCVASLLYFHDSLLLAGLCYPSSLELPACVRSKWGFILPEEVTTVPITPLGCDHCVVRGIGAGYKPCIHDVDAPGPCLPQTWQGGHGRPSPPSRRGCGAQRRPSVPFRAAPGCRLLAAAVGLARRLRGACV